MDNDTADRVRLDPLETKHAWELFEGLQDKRIYTWIEETPPESVAMLAKRYERLQARRSPDGTEVWLNWAIWSLPEQRYIGYVQATLRDKKAILAYVLFPDAWGKGFATEAVRTMIRHLGDDFGISEARAVVDRRNHRSIDLLNNLGFEQISFNTQADEEAAGPDTTFRLFLGSSR